MTSHPWRQVFTDRHQWSMTTRLIYNARETGLIFVVTISFSSLINRKCFSIHLQHLIWFCAMLNTFVLILLSILKHVTKLKCGELKNIKFSFSFISCQYKTKLTERLLLCCALIGEAGHGFIRQILVHTWDFRASI